MCYLCGLQVKHICLLLRFSDTQYVITFSSSCAPPGVCAHNFRWPVMPPCLCQELLVVGQVSPCKPVCLAELLSSACEDWMLHFLFSKRAASSPRGLRRRIFSPYVVCVCVCVLIRVTSLLRSEDNGSHYGSQGPTELH